MNTTISIRDRKLAISHLSVAYAAFLIGTFLGLLQVFIRNDSLKLPAWLDYYQVLTAHGVFSTCFYNIFYICFFDFRYE